MFKSYSLLTEEEAVGALALTDDVVSRRGILMTLVIPETFILYQQQLKFKLLCHPSHPVKS